MTVDAANPDRPIQLKAFQSSIDPPPPHPNTLQLHALLKSFLAEHSSALRGQTEGLSAAETAPVPPSGEPSTPAASLAALEVAMQEGVARGADVSFARLDSYPHELSLLHSCVLHGLVPCALACLQTPRSIDFTLPVSRKASKTRVVQQLRVHGSRSRDTAAACRSPGDERPPAVHRSLLHVVCSQASPGMAVAVLSAIVARYRRTGGGTGGNLLRPYHFVRQPEKAPRWSKSVPESSSVPPAAAAAAAWSATAGDTELQWEVDSRCSFSSSSVSREECLEDQGFQWRLPVDEIDWGMVDPETQFDLFSLAAKSHLLSAVFPVLQRVYKAVLGGKEGVIPLRVPVFPLDWGSLSPAHRACFSIENFGVLTPSQSLAQLCRLAADWGSSDLPLHYCTWIEHYVHAGADVFYQELSMNRPVLHEFLFRGLLQPALLCFSSTASLDWRASKGGDQRTVLHLLCRMKPVEKAVAVLLRLLMRLHSEEGREDRIHWFQLDRDGHDFFSHAAEHGVLADFLRLLLAFQLPWAMDESVHFELTTGFSSQKDWERLGALGLQHRFHFFKGLIPPRNANIMVERLMRGTSFRLRSSHYPILPTKPKGSVEVRLAEGRCAFRKHARHGLRVGAEPVAFSTCWRSPLLHFAIRFGLVDTVADCLDESMYSAPVDFRVAGDGGNTALHWLCEVQSPLKALVLLNLILTRLSKKIKGDAVDWHQKNSRGFTFFDCAGPTGLLPAFLMLLDRFGAFNPDDGSAEGAEKPCRSFDCTSQLLQRYHCPVECALREGATTEARRSTLASPVSLVALRHASANGMNGNDLAFYLNSRMEAPLLHQLVRCGAVEAVVACCEGEKSSLDFTLTDASGSTVLHAVCDAPLCQAVTILSVLVHRIETHPLDQVNWEQRNRRNQSFLERVVDRQLLNAFWPLLCRQASYFSQRSTLISLPRAPAVWDWALLTDFERGKFDALPSLPEGAVPRTSELGQYVVSLVLGSEVSSVEGVVSSSSGLLRLLHTWIPHGCDVLYQTIAMPYPALHELVRRGEVEAVKACLQTPHGIDFTKSGWESKTILHLIPTAAASGCKSDAASLDVCVELLKAVLLRLDERFHYDDVIHWGQRDLHGHDFLSCVARRRGLLPLVWPLLTYVPYFAAQEEAFTLTTQVYEDDWAKLKAMDQEDNFVSLQPLLKTSGSHGSEPPTRNMGKVERISIERSCSSLPCL